MIESLMQTPNTPTKRRNYGGIVKIELVMMRLGLGKTQPLPLLGFKVIK